MPTDWFAPHFARAAEVHPQLAEAGIFCPARKAFTYGAQKFVRYRRRPMCDLVRLFGCRGCGRRSFSSAADAATPL